MNHPAPDKGSTAAQNWKLTLTSSAGRTVRLRVLRPNFVNTSVAIHDVATNRSMAPLLIQYPIEKGGQYRRNGPAPPLTWPLFPAT
ncbi:MAG: hypothetical protein WKF84_15920 [Pyrinomonadaceae bacterium]